MQKYFIEKMLGKKYWHLTVVGKSTAPTNPHKSNQFLFKCDCGNTISEQPSKVVNGVRTCCGKCSYSKSFSKGTSKYGDEIIGITNGSLTSVSFEKINGKMFVRCKCVCGNTINLEPHRFAHGKLKSCGCRSGLVVPNKKDGRTNHPLYGTWKAMLDRCENPSNGAYKHYGGKGISVCDEWHDFTKFAEWADTHYPVREKLSLDRIDFCGNYEPSNCRFVPFDIQANNKSSNVIVEYKDESHTICEWAKILGIKYRTLNNRLNRGWSIERAFTQPVAKKGE